MRATMRAFCLGMGVRGLGVWGRGKGETTPRLTRTGREARGRTGPPGPRAPRTRVGVGELRKRAVISREEVGRLARAVCVSGRGRGRRDGADPPWKSISVVVDFHFWSAELSAGVRRGVPANRFVRSRGVLTERSKGGGRARLSRTVFSVSATL
jgi:hypothetical protein